MTLLLCKCDLGCPNTATQEDLLCDGCRPKQHAHVRSWTMDADINTDQPLTHSVVKTWKVTV